MTDCQIKDFISYLKQNKSDKAMMANLFRGRSSTTESYAYPYIPWNMDDKFFEKSKKVYLFIGSSFSELKSSVDDEKYNLGDSLRRLGNCISEKTVNILFRQVVDSETVEDLIARLARVVTLCKNKGIGINLTSLAKDVYWWEQDSENSTSVKWACHFYSKGK